MRILGFQCRFRRFRFRASASASTKNVVILLVANPPTSAEAPDPADRFRFRFRIPGCTKSAVAVSLLVNGIKRIARKISVDTIAERMVEMNLLTELDTRHFS